MAELKTQPTKASVKGYLAAISDPQRRADCEALVQMMSKATGEAPKIWGAAMVGFGSYRYTYDSGHSGEWALTGFASRKNDLTVYILSGFDPFPELMAKLGKYKTGKSCLYLKRLADVDQAVLAKLVKASVEAMRERWPD